ncbi:MAG: heavy metal-binding domain-containing protein [Saprospiraceae bacterium]
MKENKKGALLQNVKFGSLENMGTATYTCPMHPEVTSTKSGKCPKCGIELVKKN